MLGKDNLRMLNAFVYVGTSFETSDCAAEYVQSAQQYAVFVFMLRSLLGDNVYSRSSKSKM